jgi:hypothetical protein
MVLAQAEKVRHMHFPLFARQSEDYSSLFGFGLINSCLLTKAPINSTYAVDLLFEESQALKIICNNTQSIDSSSPARQQTQPT